MRMSLGRGLVVIGALLGWVPAAAGQGKAPPPISQRQYSGGSITVKVTGTITMDAEIPINTTASFSDGGSTWLQYGASGAAEPNALITYGETGETGVSIGRGKSSATGGIIPGGESQCTGEATVTATLVTGAYTCKGITSYEPGKGMGTVDITVRFTAKS
jgi:hypothetical protein